MLFPLNLKIFLHALKNYFYISVPVSFKCGHNKVRVVSKKVVKKHRDLIVDYAVKVANVVRRSNVVISNVVMVSYLWDVLVFERVVTDVALNLRCRADFTVSELVPS